MSCAAAAVLASGLAACGPPTPTPITVTTTELPSLTADPLAPDVDAHANAIADDGLVVGRAHVDAGTMVATVWRDGEPEALPTAVAGVPGIPASGVASGNAVAVTAAGDILGDLYDEELRVSTVVVWSGGDPIAVSQPGRFGIPVAMNEAGQVLYHEALGPSASNQRSRLWSGGTSQPLPEVDGVPLTGVGLTGTGMVTAELRRPGVGVEAYTWRPGEEPVALTAPGLSGLTPVGANDAGDVVGQGVDAAGNGHAVVWRHGVPRILPTLGGDTTYLRGSGTQRGGSVINAGGSVVGESERADGTVGAFVWHPDRGIVDLGGGPASSANALNDRGDVVGVSAGGLTLWRGGTAVPLPLPDVPPVFAVPADVNEDGMVIGNLLSWEAGTQAFQWGPSR
jgi:probable HAF family extracellular repeat protein